MSNILFYDISDNFQHIWFLLRYLKATPDIPQYIEISKNLSWYLIQFQISVYFMRCLASILFDILVYLLHIFRYLDPMKDISRHVIYQKYLKNHIMIFLRYSCLFKLCIHIFRDVTWCSEISCRISKKNLQYWRISQDIQEISSYFKYVKISQNWSYLKTTEISYIFPDILDILGYLALFSDISTCTAVYNLPDVNCNVKKPVPTAHLLGELRLWIYNVFEYSGTHKHHPR